VTKQWLRIGECRRCGLCCYMKNLVTAPALQFKIDPKLAAFLETERSWFGLFQECRPGFPMRPMRSGLMLKIRNIMICVCISPTFQSSCDEKESIRSRTLTSSAKIPGAIIAQIEISIQFGFGCKRAKAGKKRKSGDTH